MQPKIKICGMKYPENILEIAKLQPDFLGFIFWEKSTRKMQLEQLPKLPLALQKVGVFVNADPADILERITQYQLDYIQLHGTESPKYCEELQTKGIKLIKAFSIHHHFDFTFLKNYMDCVDFFLFDTQGKLPGGNGTTFDWDILQNYPYKKPYFLSGGIGMNELEAVNIFLQTDTAKYCYAIDVNSQFESEPGRKQSNILEVFLNNLK